MISGKTKLVALEDAMKSVCGLQVSLLFIICTMMHHVTDGTSKLIGFYTFYIVNCDMMLS